MAEEMAGLAVECGALSDREGRESLDEDSCDPENETSPNMEISSTRGSAPGAVAVAAGALGLGMMTPLQHPGPKLGQLMKPAKTISISSRPSPKQAPYPSAS
jgi:hypothetical protein